MPQRILCTPTLSRACPWVCPSHSNVAQYCAMKLLEKGAKVLAMSDSGGYVHEPEGLTKEQLEQVGAAAWAPLWRRAAGPRTTEAPRSLPSQRPAVRQLPSWEAAGRAFPQGLPRGRATLRSSPAASLFASSQRRQSRGCSGSPRPVADRH